MLKDDSKPLPPTRMHPQAVQHHPNMAYIIRQDFVGFRGSKLQISDHSFETSRKDNWAYDTALERRVIVVVRYYVHIGRWPCVHHRACNV